MTGETGAIGNIKDAKSEKATRVRSTIEFPYNALDDAEAIAKGVREVAVTGCDWDTLAASLNFASKGGGFRVRMLGAKVFGLITYERGRVDLTELGMRIVDPQTARGARVSSFLSVPLYKQAFEKLKGSPLPPVAAIERLLENLGVSPKQKDKARQAFIRSAKHAGFMDIAPDRLVLPAAQSGQASQLSEAPLPSLDEASPLPPRGTGGGGGPPVYHPFIQGLLDELPKPGSEWRVQDRAKWLQTSANIFDLIYNDLLDDADIIVKVSKDQLK